MNTNNTTQPSHQAGDIPSKMYGSNPDAFKAPAHNLDQKQTEDIIRLAEASHHDTQGGFRSSNTMSGSSGSHSGLTGSHGAGSGLTGSSHTGSHTGSGSGLTGGNHTGSGLAGGNHTGSTGHSGHTGSSGLTDESARSGSGLSHGTHSTERGSSNVVSSHPEHHDKNQGGFLEKVKSAVGMGSSDHHNNAGPTTAASTGSHPASHTGSHPASHTGSHPGSHTTGTHTGSGAGLTGAGLGAGAGGIRSAEQEEAHDRQNPNYKTGHNDPIGSRDHTGGHGIIDNNTAIRAVEPGSGSTTAHYDLAGMGNNANRTGVASSADNYGQTGQHSGLTGGQTAGLGAGAVGAGGLAATSGLGHHNNTTTHSTPISQVGDNTTMYPQGQSGHSTSTGLSGQHPAGSGAHMPVGSGTGAGLAGGAAGLGGASALSGHHNSGSHQQGTGVGIQSSDGSGVGHGNSLADTLKHELERNAQKSGTHASGLGTRGTGFGNN